MASSTGIYNHRTLQPTPGPGLGPPPLPVPPSASTSTPGPPSLIPLPSHVPPHVAPPSMASSSRLSEALSHIRTEYDHLSSDITMLRAQRDDFESKIGSQITELGLFRQQLYDLEEEHKRAKREYDDEIGRLRDELRLLRGEQRERESKRFKFDRDRERLPFEPSNITMPKLPLPSSSSSAAAAPPPPPSSASSYVPSAPPPSSTLSSYSTAPTTQQMSPPPAADDPREVTPYVDPLSLPNAHKATGSDWFAVYPPLPASSSSTTNPSSSATNPGALNVHLVHALMHESVVCCVRFSHDGKFLATGCNRTAQIYDVKTGAKTCVLSLSSSTDPAAVGLSATGNRGDLYIRSVCFSPDNKYLATGAEDKQIRIWDIAKRRIRNVFDGHQQEIYSLDFSSDGRLVVSGSGDKTARIWDMLDGTSRVLTINDTDSAGNDAGVTSVAISPDNRFVAAGSLDTVVRIWDVQSGQLVERLRGHRDSVYSVAFTPDGKGLISGSLDKSLKYWDVSHLTTSSGKDSRKLGGVDGGKCVLNFVGHKDYVLSVAVSHDGRYVVSGSKDRGVQFWDLPLSPSDVDPERERRGGEVKCMLQGHKNSVISIDLSPTANVLATGSGDWQARIWGYS